tara:strand:- start:151 stop:468 length:318 start_codon:yes stop_codon:yes gene_type:complete
MDEKYRRTLHTPYTKEEMKDMDSESELLKVEKINNKLFVKIPRNLIRAYKIKEKDILEVDFGSDKWYRYVAKCKCKGAYYSTHKENYTKKCSVCGSKLNYILKKK